VVENEFLGDAYGFSCLEAVLMDIMLMHEMLGDFLLCCSWPNTETMEEICTTSTGVEFTGITVLKTS
jgi:hypothetical protein